MATIVTRAGKGSPLTNTEMDSNLTNLNTDKLETSTVGVTVQPYSANLTSYATTAPTAAGLAILDDANAAAQRATLGLTIGTDVQAFDADIPTVAASQAEMEAGTEVNLRSMSPLHVAQAIAALTPTQSNIPTKLILSVQPFGTSSTIDGKLNHLGNAALTYSTGSTRYVQFTSDGVLGSYPVLTDSTTSSTGGPWTAPKNPIFYAEHAQNAEAGTRYIGFTSTNTTTPIANGIYFRATLNGNYFAVTRSSSVETATNTGIACSTTLRKLKFVVTGGGTSVAFYVDDVLKATHTTNIPSASLLVLIGNPTPQAVTSDRLAQLYCEQDF